MSDSGESDVCDVGLGAFVSDSGESDTRGMVGRTGRGIGDGVSVALFRLEPWIRM